MEKKEKNNYNNKFYKNKRVEEIEKRLKEIEEELERRLRRNVWDNEDLWVEQQRLLEELERIKRNPEIVCEKNDERKSRGNDNEPEMEC